MGLFGYVNIDVSLCILYINNLILSNNPMGLIWYAHVYVARLSNLRGFGRWDIPPLTSLRLRVV